MTLTLSPEIEKALMEESVRQGTTPEELVIEALRMKFPVLKESPEDFQARVHALNGSMAHLGPGRILEERAADRILEERHWPCDELIQQHHLPTQIFPNYSLGK